jgi:hypothetical protein
MVHIIDVHRVNFTKCTQTNQLEVMTKESLVSYVIMSQKDSTKSIHQEPTFVPESLHPRSTRLERTLVMLL